MPGKKRAKLSRRVRKKSGNNKHHRPGAISSPSRPSRSVIPPTAGREDEGGGSASGSDREDVDVGKRREQLRREKRLRNKTTKAITKMAAQSGKNTILRKENEELKEDQLVANARIKKLEKDTKNLNEQTTGLKDRVKKRSERFQDSQKKASEKQATIKNKMNTKLVELKKVLQEENEELKNDQVVAHAHLETLEKNNKHLTEETAALHDLMKIRSKRFQDSQQKSNEKQATVKQKLVTKLAETEKIARTNIAAQRGTNTILQEENEELKEDQLLSAGRVKKLEEGVHSLTKEASDLQDLVKIRSVRFIKSLDKLNGKQVAIKTKLNTKLVEAEKFKEDQRVSDKRMKTLQQLQSKTQSASKRKQVSIVLLYTYDESFVH